MMIYKIFRPGEWAQLSADGQTRGAPIDLEDGYIHFSTAAQVPETVAKHFAGEDPLWLVACASDGFGAALKWEPSRGGALFPHLYRALSESDIAWAKPLNAGSDGRHGFPEEMV